MAGAGAREAVRAAVDWDMCVAAELDMLTAADEDVCAAGRLMSPDAQPAVDEYKCGMESELRLPVEEEGCAAVELDMRSTATAESSVAAVDGLE